MSRSSLIFWPIKKRKLQQLISPGGNELQRYKLGVLLYSIVVQNPKLQLPSSLPLGDMSCWSCWFSSKISSTAIFSKSQKLLYLRNPVSCWPLSGLFWSTQEYYLSVKYELEIYFREGDMRKTKFLVILHRILPKNHVFIMSPWQKEINSSYFTKR